MRTIPSDASAAQAEFPWIAFEGRWGELQEAFFNGPTGPNLKRSWVEPVQVSEGWREEAYAVPTGGALGTGATDFFCAAVATGSVALIRWLQEPVLVLLALAALFALVFFVAWRATWRPVAPLRVARRRSWGQILAAAGRMYVGRAPLFLGIGLLLIPTAMVTAVLQQLLLGGAGLLGIDTGGESGGALVLVVVGIGTTLTLLGLALVQAATTCALAEIDAGRSIGPIRAYRIALTRARPLLGALAIAVAAWAVLTATVVLIPVAVWLVVRWALFSQIVELEDRPAVSALRRSAELVRGRWFHVASLVGVGAALALLAGPVPRRPPHPPHECAAGVAQSRLRDRPCARHAVRRADDLLRVFRRADAARARGTDEPRELPAEIQTR